MDEPAPAEGWPDRPLTEAEAIDLLGERDAVAVWAMDHDEGVRQSVAPAGDEHESVVDVVLETGVAFEMYSFTGGQWLDYGTQAKDDEEAPSMAGTLEAYRVLAGESEAFPDLA
jgi:hypothetical protein